MTQLAKNATSITLKVTSLTNCNLVKVVMSESKILRFKITHTQVALGTSYFLYGTFAPAANKLILIPFNTINSQPCKYFFERNPYISSFTDTLTVQFFAPGSDPLTASPVATMSMAPGSSVATPFLPSATGTWYAVFTNLLRSKVVPLTGIASEYFSIKLTSYSC